MKKAFSLLEIIISLLILSVVSALAVPKIITYLNESKKIKTTTVAQDVLSTAQNYFAMKSACPDTTTILDFVKIPSECTIQDITCDENGVSSVSVNCYEKYSVTCNLDNCTLTEL
jgi:prepilin-type N-terminal cleavage/methylation domain-containing protein